MFEQFRICFCYGCSVGFLPDWVFQNYVAHGVPSRPTNPTDGQHAVQRFRRKNILIFSCSTPAESAVKRCALAYRRHANHADPDLPVGHGAEWALRTDESGQAGS
jgi:hypothetical protein